MATPSPVITASGLRKAYGDFEAVRGIDLEVQTGEVFAFLGPNGAGKTTTTEIFEGYRPRTGGTVSVLGGTRPAPTREWRERIGIVLQQCRMRPELTVRETLELYAGYYRAPLGSRRRSTTSASPRRRSAGGQPLRWSAAPARRGRRADRRSRAALPRRADDRLRPLGQTPVLGRGREPQAARQERLPHHPLHGRGPAARRPGGDHRRGPDRRRGPARRAGRPRATARVDPLPGQRRRGRPSGDPAG